MLIRNDQTDRRRHGSAVRTTRWHLVYFAITMAILIFVGMLRHA